MTVNYASAFRRVPNERPFEPWSISGKSAGPHRGEVSEALVLIWAASDLLEWENRIVNIPEP
jgi:hypothetical protein